VTVLGNMTMSFTEAGKAWIEQQQYIENQLALNNNNLEGNYV